MNRMSLFMALALSLLISAWRWRDTEPYFNNDETRHVMTGVFIRDALVEGAWSHPRSYAIDYYLRLPALGLLVWPPGYYMIEGLWMYFVGPSYTAARMLLIVISVVTLFYCHRLARLSLDTLGAGLAVLLCAVTPMMVQYREHIMLEMPTLMCLLAAAYYLELFVRHQQTRDSVLMALWWSGACWMRYDAVLFIIVIMLRVLVGQHWRCVIHRGTAWAVVILLVFVTPLYAATWTLYQRGLSAASTVGTSAIAREYSLVRGLTYYLLETPHQLGTMLACFSAGAIVWGTWKRIQGSAIHLTMIAATYLFFSPLAELEARHSIYWIPSLAILVAMMCLHVLGGLKYHVLAMLILATGVAALNQPRYVVHGYRQAAEYVAKRSSRKVCLFEGLLNGGFIYHIGSRPDARDWTVLRADKIFYGVLSDVAGGYEEWTKSDDETIRIIHQLDPEYIIAETPRVLTPIPAADRLRRLLENHPDAYEREVVIPITGNHPSFVGHQLVIYRKRIRNPNPKPMSELKMLSLGGVLKR
jgi:hypothetical protein